MNGFARHAAFLFIALRAGDFVNLAAGLWFVPKFITSSELGAVLPVTTFATMLVMPIFAFGMAVMKESADLAGRHALGQLKSLWRGVFITIALLTAVSLLVTRALLPHFLVRMRVSDSAAGFFILAAALLGAVAPVYTDALQSVKRFRALGGVEITAALARFVTLLLVMPLRAFAGYFAGNAMQPLVRIVASVFALREHLAVPAAHWWTRENTRTLFARFLLTLLYLALPMLVSSVEQSLVRTELPNASSAAYYVMTRLSDILNYLTFPLLIVLFPYAADAARNGKSTRPLVIKTSCVTLATALLLGMVYACGGGAWVLGLMPNGKAYADYLPHVPILLAITSLTACQTFYTNAEVAAGRFKFLWWFVPAQLLYLLALAPTLNQGTTLSCLLAWFLGGALVRFVCAVVAAFLAR